MKKILMLATIALLIIITTFVQTVAMGDNVGEITLNVFDNIDKLELTKVEAEQRFIIEDDTIVGLTSTGIELSRLILPDTIDGQTVNVDYDSLSAFDRSVNITLNRSYVDLDAVNILAQQREQFINITIKALKFYGVSLIVSLIFCTTLSSLLSRKER